jgi:hypothetical protein
MTDDQRDRLAQLRYYQRMIPDNRGRFALGGLGQEGDRALADLGFVEDACPWEPFKYVRITTAGLASIKDYRSTTWG